MAIMETGSIGSQARIFRQFSTMCMSVEDCEEVDHAHDDCRWKLDRQRDYSAKNDYGECNFDVDEETSIFAFLKRCRCQT